MGVHLPSENLSQIARCAGCLEDAAHDFDTGNVAIQIAALTSDETRGGGFCEK